MKHPLLRPTSQLSNRRVSFFQVVRPCQKGLAKILTATLLFAPLATTLMTAEDAFARAGRGRSSGRTLNRAAPPASTPRSPSAQPSHAPAGQPSQGSQGAGAASAGSAPVSGGTSAYPQQPAGAINSQPIARDMQPPRQGGGFMRQMGTAIAGGFLGSMLFSGLSHGLSGTSGTPGLVSPDGAPGSRSSGFGVLEILLLGLVGYIGYRVWKNRQEKMALSTPMGQFSSQGGGLMDSFKSLDDNRRSPLSAVSESGPLSGSVQNPPPTGNHRPFLSDPEIGLAGSSSPAGVSQGLEGQRGDDADDVDEDQVKNRIRDVFYRVQTAWSRRDLKAVRTLMTPEMYYNLESDLSDLLEAREINRLENISIADVDLVKTWREEGDLLLGARIVAYMLDYTVNETSQAILKGSSTDPIRFEETWIFQKSTTGSQWMLAGIQVESAQKI